MSRPRAAERNNASRLLQGLRLLRGSVAQHLISGGANCSDQLKQEEISPGARLRATVGEGVADTLGDGEGDASVRLRTPREIVQLGSSDRSHADRIQGDRFQ